MNAPRPAARATMVAPDTTTAPGVVVTDPRQSVARVFRDLRTSARGLSGREAARRLIRYGPNELRRTAGQSWVRRFGRQILHPLALLLWGAALLCAATQAFAIAVAIVAVIVVNAAFAFVQEQQAEQAVELLGRYLPPHATVLRDNRRTVLPVASLVPGDVLFVEEGDRISADARLFDGELEVDTSMMTGESMPGYRSAAAGSPHVPLLQATDLVFSGTTCTGGSARAVVFATGMHTELGRIAALSQRVDVDESPLEHQVRRVAWLIAIVALAVGVAFLPLGVFAAGLPFSSAALFAIGLLVSNVPEGLLPTITLALAAGVRSLAARGALVKRLSAVETLGSTTVICTDKTGTLTENRMRVSFVAVDDLEPPVSDVVGGTATNAAIAAVIDTIAACNTADVDSPDAPVGDPTEISLLQFAAATGRDVSRERRERARLRLLHFDPARKLMSTIDHGGADLIVHTKGAPEAVLARCGRVLDADGVERPFAADRRAAVDATIERYARNGLRVLAIARGDAPPDASAAPRDEVERDLCLCGVVAMFDPPRAEVAEAVARCHDAGMRVMVVTGDHPLTAAQVARQVGIDATTVVKGDALDAMSDAELDDLLATHREIVFARNSPEAKLRIADALRAIDEVVAMTGDGVNDAPALRRADIGIAMGRSGTDVARDAATMILTDDNFASITRAVEEGRRVYANVRKFVFYIFVHATPEVVPFLLFALSGGAIPLPLTVMQILAIDLGTETLPALALGREPIEPGAMTEPPRPRHEGVIQRPMLVRAWLFLGGISAVLVVFGFLAVLLQAGWTPGADVGTGSALHHAYVQATTMTFLGIVACQVGTAFAARVEHASLRSIGFTSNPLLLYGIGFEIVFAFVVVAGPFQRLFHTAVPPAWALAILPIFPLVVWGADELRRLVLRRRGTFDLAEQGPAAVLRPRIPPETAP